MNEVPVSPWCTSHFEQQVGLDTLEALSRLNYSRMSTWIPENTTMSCYKFTVPGYIFHIFTKMQPLSRGDKTHGV